MQSIINDVNVDNEYVKINADLIHQVNEEDVLVCNGYYAFPSVITASQYKEHVEGKFNASELELFNRTYKEYTGGSDIEGVVSNNDYALRSVLLEIPASDLRFDNEDEERDVLDDNYKISNGKYQLNTIWLSEYAELKLLMLTGNNDLMINSNQKMRLSNAFEKHDFPLEKQRLHTTMFNDTRHPYFYKKEHEHVPGMMMVEAVRQGLYAFIYKFKGCKRGEVSISISSLDIEFYYYTQSNYPLRIMTEEVVNDESDDNHVVKLKAQLFQRNRLVGEIRYCGDIIKMNVFKRLRSMGKDEEKYTFSPVKNIEKTVVLVEEDSICLHICKLKEISMTGMRLSIPNSESFDEKKKFTYIVSIKGKDKFTGSCLIESKSSNEEETEVVVRFEKLSKRNAMMISDCIKNYTYINDKEFIV